MSAIRMVAFGVLEYAQPNNTLPFDKDYVEYLDKADEIERLVCAEIAVLGWKLAHKAIARPTRRAFVLLGPVTGSKALPGRVKIGEGTLQQVCMAAVNWLDSEAALPEPTHTTLYPD
jgi:hypothetical protein